MVIGPPFSFTSGCSKSSLYRTMAIYIHAPVWDKDVSLHRMSQNYTYTSRRLYHCLSFFINVHYKNMSLCPKYLSVLSLLLFAMWVCNFVYHRLKHSSTRETTLHSLWLVSNIFLTWKVYEATILLLRLNSRNSKKKYL